VLLRGCKGAPDLRAITLRLDDLYGASVGPLVRRVGDYQTTGLYSSFIADRYGLDGDKILASMAEFLRQLLLEPVTQNGVFSKDFVESEKKNLIAAIEAQRNDKRAYTSAQLLRKMCASDSFGIPRLGEVEQVRKITPEAAYAHYQKILTESPVELFYVGEAEPEQVAALMMPLFAGLERNYVNLKEQTSFRSAGGGEFTETMDVAQGRLAMGFVTPITLRDPDFAAMQVCNTVLGAGMTSKLFMNVREKMSLCYDIGSGYHGSKGIMVVSAGIDFSKERVVREEVLRQLEAICDGDISPAELTSAKQALCSSLRSTHDSPGAIESYYATAALSGLSMTPSQYLEKVEDVTAQQVSQAAKSLKLDTVFFLKGVQ
jgi:predicted Zn-dependent peptidase